MICELRSEGANHEKLEKEQSRQREKLAQRPRGRDELGMFEEEKNSWSRKS